MEEDSVKLLVKDPRFYSLTQLSSTIESMESKENYTSDNWKIVLAHRRRAKSEEMSLKGSTAKPPQFPPLELLEAVLLL